jgi:hypothetical protein
LLFCINDFKNQQKRRENIKNSHNRTCIPKTQIDRLAIDHHVCAVIVKHRRNVLARERIRRVRNQQARLADGTITNNDTLD